MLFIFEYKINYFQYLMKHYSYTKMTKYFTTNHNKNQWTDY